MHIGEIYHYPVKGLGGSALDATAVSAAGLPFDRRYAIALGSSRPDTSADAPWRPWEHYVSLKNQPRAAMLSAAASEDSSSGAALLTLRAADGSHASGDPQQPPQRRELEEFLGDHLQLAGLQLVDSPTPLWDERGMAVSLINRASVHAIAADFPMQPARFRGNLIIDGAEAWREAEWRHTLAIGDIALAVVEPIPRCAATLVNPDTAQRDGNPVQLLRQQRGDDICGVYATVARGGALAAGMELRVEPPA